MNTISAIVAWAGQVRSPLATSSNAPGGFGDADCPASSSPTDNDAHATTITATPHPIMANSS